MALTTAFASSETACQLGWRNGGQPALTDASSLTSKAIVPESSANSRQPIDQTSTSYA